MRITPAQRRVIVGVGGSPNPIAAPHRAAKEAEQRATRLRIANGSPAAALTGAAERADLLVIGARAHSEERNLFSGDTVPQVLSATPCEVVVCADQASSAPAA